MLKKLAMPLLALSLLSPSLMADNKIKTQEQKAGYVIGIQLGKQLLVSKDDIDLESLKMGMNDIFKGKDSKLSNEEINNAMQAFQVSKQKKEQALIAELSKKGKDFLAANKKKKGVVTLKSGLQYKVLKKGDGKVSPKATDSVTTHYHGTLINGAVFDSSYERGQPATFGVNRVIPGWTEALQKMKVGDKWQLVIPPSLAYGKRGAPPSIGPDATLIFDVELLEIK